MTSEKPTTLSRAHSITCDLGAAACVVVDGKILLVEEAAGKHASRWGAPKGYVNIDEYPMQAALRELKEECGIDGEIKGIIAVRETIRSGVPALFIAYLIHPENTDIVIDNEEISDFGWFDITEIESVNFISKTMKSIAKCALMDAPHMLCLDGSEQTKLPYYLHVQNSDF
tara:strand:- start:5644 stop:6156 length:513 start_codon:yes stop_codon:yes gene_type:complete